MSQYPAASVKLSARPEAVRIARLLVSHVLSSWELEFLDDDARLIVSELVTNAVRNGSLVAVQVRVQPNALVVEVWDPSSELPMPRSPDDDAESGRGLHLVKALSDRWNVWEPVSGGKVVYAELDVEKTPKVALDAEPFELPEAIVSAQVTGTGALHFMADCALMGRFIDGLAMV